MGIPLVATSDCPLRRSGRRRGTRHLLCMQHSVRFRTRRKRGNEEVENDLVLPTQSRSDVNEKFPRTRPDAPVAAESKRSPTPLTSEIEVSNKYFFPSFRMPEQKTPAAISRELGENKVLDGTHEGRMTSDRRWEIVREVMGSVGCANFGA